MDPFGESLIVEDLIECDGDEAVENPHSAWTEQALDLLISLLQSAIRNKFTNEQEMLQAVTNKMTNRNFSFTLSQIEYKYNSLKQMYKDKKDKNLEIEPELIKLFGPVRTKSRNPPVEQKEHPSTKRQKIADTSDSSQQDGSFDEEQQKEEHEKSKLIWSIESNKHFLELLEEHRPQLGSKYKTKKQMWVEIAKCLNAKGYNFTWPQIENKWKYLVRYYRNRLEMQRSGKKPRPKSKIKKSHPVFVKKEPTTSSKKLKETVLEVISFANDQKLPFDDDDDEDNVYNGEVNADADGCDDDGFVDEKKFDLADAELPETSVFAGKNLDQEVHEQKNVKTDDSFSTQLDKLATEICYFRRDIRKYQYEALAIKKQQLELSKEQNKQFKFIGNALKELLTHLQQRDGHE